MTATQIEQKAPRSTVDVLELIPGVFVESTAGPVSNNYSVRGLPGYQTRQDFSGYRGLPLAH